MAKTTLRPSLSAYASLVASISSVSPKYSRRSEWPSSTHLMPIATSCSTAVSPVKAPQPVKLAFCGQMTAPLVIILETSGTCTGDGHTYTSHPAVSHLLMLAASLVSSEGLLGLHFQLPPTMGLRTCGGAGDLHRGHVMAVALKENVHAGQTTISGGRLGATGAALALPRSFFSSSGAESNGSRTNGTIQHTKMARRVAKSGGLGSTGGGGGGGGRKTPSMF